MDIKINRKIYRDKVYACWLGKNIGGTMGTPFEGNPDLLDIKGFTSKKGEPLPNDDLDLQIVWLKALNEVGALNLDANILSWYWRKYIPAKWNEYGVGQNNASVGFTPPMSGELYNDGWNASNGAWIRSEIWACLAPGFPNFAAKYAIMEASIDHGVSEGTIAEIFTSTLESIAFVESDLRTAITGALKFIPEDSRVAQSVRLVTEEYDKGTDWKDTRQKVLSMNSDLGYFMAPSNIAYVVIGLLYGEGDFLQSLIYAINCGDDTDCTGATVGSVLGILGGTASIPDELKDYIGDRIITKSLDISSFWDLPATCADLTERVVRTMPLFMAQNKNGRWFDFDDFTKRRCFVEYTDREDAPFSTFSNIEPNGYTMHYLATPPLTTFHKNHWLSAEVTFEDEPRISPMGDITFEVRLRNNYYQLYNLSVRVMTPDGWTASYPKAVCLQHRTGHRDINMKWVDITNDTPSFKVTITANERTESFNRIYIAIEALDSPEPLVIPVTIMG